MCEVLVLGGRVALPTFFSFSFNRFCSGTSLHTQKIFHHLFASSHNDLAPSPVRGRKTFQSFMYVD